jgi:polyhydroxyalkanoate synthesis repressor PhaR
MAKTNEPTVIKKYANRRLYNTGTSTYVTLEDLAAMVKAEEDFVVFEARTGEDITRSVLTQIIFEQESKGQNLLPVAFLRQLIRFYGDSLQALVPSYLEFSLASLTREQTKWREQMNQTFGATGFDPATAFTNPDDLVRRNTELFQNAMRMFMPFGAATETRGEARTEPKPAEDKPAHPGELDALKRQMDEVMKRLDALAAKK